MTKKKSPETALEKQKRAFLAACSPSKVIGSAIKYMPQSLQDTLKDLQIPDVSKAFRDEVLQADEKEFAKIQERLIQVADNMMGANDMRGTVDPAILLSAVNRLRSKIEADNLLKTVQEAKTAPTPPVKISTALAKDLRIGKPLVFKKLSGSNPSPA